MGTSYRTANIGQSATPASELYTLAEIVGSSRGLGDASDTSGTTQSGTSSNVVVGGGLAAARMHLALVQQLPTRIRRGCRVVKALLHLYCVSSVQPDDLVATDGTSVVELWRINRQLSVSAGVITGISFQNYFAASAWEQFGMKFGVGGDSEADPAATFEWTQGNHDAASVSGGVVDKVVDIRGEVQWALDTDVPVQLMLRARWGTAARAIGINSGYTPIADPWGWLEVAYKYAIETYGSASGAMNLTDLKTVDASGSAQHLWLGMPSRGTAGTVAKFWSRSEVAQEQPAVVVHAGKAQITNVDNRGVAGTGRMRFARVRNTAGSDQAQTGTWRFLFTATTTFGATFRADGSEVFSATGITSPTGISTTSDRTIVKDGKNALDLFAVAFTGTFAAGDVVTVDTRADLHTAERPLSSLDDVYLAPHAVGSRTSALTTKKRAAARAVTTQLYADDTSVIENSGGESGVAAIVTDGVHSGLHVKVPDPSIFTVGDWATLATFDAADEPSVELGTRVEHLKIKHVYPIGGGGDYEGQVGFEESPSNPGDFANTSILTTGVWLGKLKAPDQTFLAQTATSESGVIVLAEPLLSPTGNLVLLDLDTGNTEVRTIDHVSLDGKSVTLTAAPSRTYPVGTLVYRSTETATQCPWFAFANPPAISSKGRRQGFLSVVSVEVV